VRSFGGEIPERNNGGKEKTQDEEVIVATGAKDREAEKGLLGNDRPDGIFLGGGTGEGRENKNEGY